MQELEKRLGFEFGDKQLLLDAVTHSSYANEHHKSGAVCNERLEFLGDSVLGVIVAKNLYLNNPDMPEGDMTRLRSELVCEQSLAQAARSLDLGSFLRLGRGEEQGGGRERPSILADAMEAVIAAVYLDGGGDSAVRLIGRLILEPMLDAERSAQRDYKTALQEVVQRKSSQVLSYAVVGENGPDHNKTFEVEVSVNGEIRGRGRGRSKKEAEQSAAKNALESHSI